MKETVRVASGQGFWGDLLTAPYDQVTKGRIDYIMMDYLAEVTMSIMQKQRRKDSRLGYAKDLIPLLEQILPLCVERNIKVVTNGGGVNPTACRDAIFQAVRKLSIRNLTIGVVVGDDILNRLDELREKGIDLKNMETGESLDCVRDRVMNANVYFGAWPIVEALSQGAQVVITGRTTDTALTYAPMVYEFGWSKTDWDKLAAGTVSGHILECGAQASGGNFSSDWRGVPDLAHIGFPIAEAYEKGEIVVTKHENTGGIVSSATVKEQLLYEIGDPRNYVTPDCIADFTTIHLEEEGKNRVRVTGVKGRPATEFYKVSMSYADGFTAVGTLTYAWPDALDKAKKADEVLRTRLADLRLEFDEIRTEFLGYNSSHGPLSGPPGNLNEVVLRIGVRAHDYDAVERFGKEITPLILAGPPAVTGFGGGRPKPSEVIAYWPALIPKSEVSWEVIVEEL